MSKRSRKNRRKNKGRQTYNNLMKVIKGPAYITHDNTLFVGLVPINMQPEPGETVTAIDHANNRTITTYMLGERIKGLDFNATITSQNRQE